MLTNQDWNARRLNALPNGLASGTKVHVARALNAELWDVEGRRYIDFAGGIGVQNVGHRHPRVVEAVTAQLDRFWHTAFQVAPYNVYIELCERLNALAPFPGKAKSALFTSGAEAVENAIKVARAATGRSAIIAFSGGFHGRTQLGMALTGKVRPYKQSLNLAIPGIFHLPFPVERYGTTTAQSLAALDRLFRSDVDSSDVAAIIVEPVQGEGGFNVAPTELLQALRDQCNRHGILMIADEVQTGFARTGRLFGIEHSGVSPDLITVAKSLGGGLPISGVIGRAELMDTAPPGGLGGTYGGPPIACAAALAVLDVIFEEGLLQRSIDMGTRIRDRIGTIVTESHVAGIHGLGGMIGFDLGRPDDLTTPDGDAVKRVLATALDKGLIAISCGVYGETIRVLAPLTIEADVLEEGLDILTECLISVARA